MRPSAAPIVIAPWPVPVASALRRVLAKGYGAKDFMADALAGVVVGIVALPLSMALAIAVGVAPEHGLYTAIIAGTIVALLGGSKFQVTGPTAAFVVILAPVATRFGIEGLLTAGVLAGLLLIAMGLARIGNLIEFIPYPVTTGFTSGIATVIATLQIKDALGLETAKLPEHFVEKVSALWAARGTAHGADCLAFAATFALLLGLPRVLKSFPAPLVAISLVAVAATLAPRFVPGFSVATIGTRFHAVVAGKVVAGIPGALPPFGVPWGARGLSFSDVRELTSAAFAIAMLGAIESLLSAVVADGMTNTKHDPNAELVALGVGNVVAPFFGGIAATGALARTATNIRAGARSPFAAVIHSAVVLLAILAFAPLVAFIPMASLAALLVLVAWNMSEARNFVGIARVAPKSDVLVLVTCYLLTVFFDMVLAVSIGFVLAALLFMRRMAEITESHVTLDTKDEDGEPIPVPEGVLLYEINGPLFFGAAQRAMSALANRRDASRVVVLHLGGVPTIDVTGLVALENAIGAVVRQKKSVVIAGPLPKPRAIFDKANLKERFPGLVVTDGLEVALETAKKLADNR